MPKFKLEEIEDFYTYYVQILNVDENIFWYADIDFLERIVENKSAYDNWMHGVMKKR